ATMDFEAYDTGVVSSLLVEEGATVAIGERVAVLGEDADDSGDSGEGGASGDSDEPEEDEESEDTGEPAAGEETGGDEEPGDEAAASGGSGDEESGGDEESDADEVSGGSEESADSASASEEPDGAAVRISPLARKMAEKHDIDTGQIEGTGPRGRIIRVDVEKAISDGGAPGDDGQADQAAQTETAAQKGSSEDTTVSLNANQRVTAKRLSDNAGV